MYSCKTGPITVEVTPRFLPDQSSPDESRWFWAYTVNITNTGDEPVQLVSRYWRIINGRGMIEEVEGPGVVGEQPTIKAGDHYRYTSGCPLDTASGSMEGHYEMVRANGSRFRAVIPAFSLDIPDAGRTLN